MWSVYEGLEGVYQSRKVDIILSLRDLDLLTVGMVNDIFVENQNDDYEYDEVADQADFDAF